MNTYYSFMKVPKINSSGFTLVELMMTLFISIFISATIYIAYTGQHRTQIAQDELIQVQQNIRAASAMLVTEMRMAGYKPPSSTETVGLDDAVSDVANNILHFYWEDDADITAGAVDYDITYTITNDADDDGQADAPAGVGNLTRTINGGTDSIIENVVAIEFYYTLADETDNNIYDPISTLSPTASEIDKIRSVDVTIIARGEREARDSVKGPDSYVTAGNAVINVDNNYRHRILTTSVELRNLGL